MRLIRDNNSLWEASSIARYLAQGYMDLDVKFYDVEELGDPDGTESHSHYFGYESLMPGDPREPQYELHGPFPNRTDPVIHWHDGNRVWVSRWYGGGPAKPLREHLPKLIAHNPDIKWPAIEDDEPST